MAPMIKEIAVHLTGSNEDATRIAHAAVLARMLDARLLGLQVHVMPEVLSMTDPSGSTFLQDLMLESIDRAAGVTGTLRQKLAATGLNHDIRRLDLFPGDVAPGLAAEARSADLFVGTRPYGDPNRQHGIEEAVLFESGRPCLFVPPGLTAPATYRHAMVAWKDGREAARAVADAVPLLRTVETVTVALIEEGDASEARREAPDEDIGRYLSRQGVTAEVHLVTGWKNISAAILNEAERQGTDLIVMGGYGHSRLREWALGGATRDVLSSAKVPVLVSH